MEKRFLLGRANLMNVYFIVAMVLLTPTPFAYQQMAWPSGNLHNHWQSNTVVSQKMRENCQNSASSLPKPRTLRHKARD